MNFAHLWWRTPFKSHQDNISIQAPQEKEHVKRIWSFDSISIRQRGQRAWWGSIEPNCTSLSPVFNFSKLANQSVSFARGGDWFCQIALMTCLERMGLDEAYKFSTILLMGKEYTSVSFHDTPSVLFLLGDLRIQLFSSLLTSSNSQSYGLRHSRFQDHIPSCQAPIWLMKKFFWVERESNLGKLLYRGPAFHHLSGQKRIDSPLPTFRIIPFSTTDLIFDVSLSFF